MGTKQIALAKLSRPRLHDVLARTRLHALLDKAGRRRVIWLCAPPGAGKTTLVASYAQARKRPGIWYQLDPADGDPASFVYHLRMAAGAADEADALPLLTPEYQGDLPGFSRRFFRALFARLGPGALLVLDNFQDVPEDAAFHRVVAEAMAQVPDGINIMVASRVEPPPAYAPLLADDAIALVEGDELRLTLAETQAIADKRGLRDAAAVQALHERSHGWAAGLTLLLVRARRTAAHVEDDDLEPLQHVFSYFAQRVFDDMPPPHQRALMLLSFAPLLTADLALALTGTEDVARVLDQLYKRRLFIDRRRLAAAGAIVYQFHALFCTFLQHQAQARLGADACRDTVRRAGHLLDADGHWEPALELLLQARDWEGCARIVRVHAEALLGQGRQRSLLDWLERMPAHARERDAWLAYWQGRALMQASPDRALPVLAACQAVFAAASDVAGQVAGGAAAVQTLWYARLGWSEIGPWIERLEPLLRVPITFPSASVELMSRSALHAALAFCRPQHPAIRELGLQLLALIDDESIGWDQRLSTATHLMTWLHNAAEHELAMRLIGKVDALVDVRPASALNKSFWLVFRAIHDIRQADLDAAAARFQRAEDLAHQEGLAHAEFAAMQFHSYLDILARRPDDARARISRMETHPARTHPDAEMNFCLVQTMLAQLTGDARAALEHAQRTLQAVDRVGAAYFQAVFPPLVASAFAQAGHPERALQIVANARALCAGSYLEAMEAQLLLEEASIAFFQGDAALGHARLAHGLRLAAAERARAAYAHRVLARRPALLADALRAGIEVEFVRGVIRRWRIPPPAQEVPHWPWPVRVRTLGAFEVLVNDAPIEFGRKAPKKTLALLKAVIARGGSAPEGALVDTFWPDEEGDGAARSLAAAVHRLRALLGDGDAVVQQGGQVALDRERVWVDAWAFERALERGPDAPPDALALYRGAFLAEEEGEAWPVAMRERLRSKFIQAVGDHAARLEGARRDEDAIAWYLRGLDADNVVEPFYQGLMRCYYRLDRLPEAVSAYRRLKQTLSVTLSLPPSAGTERLYRSLRLDAAPDPRISRQ